ncbi:hypothetical protein COY23_03640 [bacterium (Candidatus Torokbacteria) CG_4_10_14_0_2_um_filter_35_8]|nr:MAG: hypothetical protein COY23_03640 [bacterium (Candidatus Torokbacteria) CG_4_10_14_0_2_um_filter_35_8]
MNKRVIIFLSVLFVPVLVLAGILCFTQRNNSSDNNIVINGSSKVVEGEDLRVVFVDFVENEDRYDLVAKVENPNELLGFSDFSYIFKVLDEQDELLLEKEGRSFILPKESKYLIELGISLDKKPKRVKLEIIPGIWQELKAYKTPSFIVLNQRYNIEDKRTVLSGLLQNNSLFSFAKVSVNAILLGSGNKVVGVNRTFAGQLLSGEERYIEFLWRGKLSEDVDIELKVEVNVFQSESYMNVYGEKVGYERDVKSKKK